MVRETRLVYFILYSNFIDVKWEKESCPESRDPSRAEAESDLDVLLMLWSKYFKVRLSNVRVFLEAESALEWGSVMLLCCKVHSGRSTAV